LTAYRDGLEELVRERTAELEKEVDERISSEQAAIVSQQRFRDIFDSLADPVYIADMEGKIVAANAQASRDLGYSNEELCAKSITDLDAIATSPEALSVQLCNLTDSEGIFFESIHQRKDGSQFPVEVHVQLIDFDGRQALLGAARNISERKQAEEDRQKLEQQLLHAQKLESLGVLAGGIAHDFNNILTAIIGNLSLAMLDLQIDEPARERLAEAEQACQQAQNLSQQLLTFSKGGAPIKKIVSIKDLAAESASFACRGSQVLYQPSLPDNLWAVEADPGQISQVLHNLVINAIQAMPSGGMVRVRGENLEVETGSELGIDAGRYVKISIQDEGVGISADHLAKIFDPYFTTKQTGSGLGLATAYSIIKNHRGHISVESKLEQGSTFNIYLPASDRKVTQQLQEGGELIAGKGKILLMDDEPMVRMVLGKMLLTIGYEVEAAEDGAKAVELYTRALDTGDPFVSVILDLTVPGGMGGKEVMERLLKIDPQIKAIVSSGYSDDPVMANFQSYGFTDVIAKPYRISELDKVLKKALVLAGWK
jgi:PAS domain S-box-containing protein